MLQPRQQQQMGGGQMMYVEQQPMMMDPWLAVILFYVFGPGRGSGPWTPDRPPWGLARPRFGLDVASSGLGFYVLSFRNKHSRVTKITGSCPEA